MHEDLQMCLQMAEEQMQDGIKHLTDELSKVRAGKASPALVSHVTVDYYGTTVSYTHLTLPTTKQV